MKHRQENAFLRVLIHSGYDGGQEEMLNYYLTGSTKDYSSRMNGNYSKQIRVDNVNVRLRFYEPPETSDSILKANYFRYDNIQPDLIIIAANTNSDLKNLERNVSLAMSQIDRDKAKCVVIVSDATPEMLATEKALKNASRSYYDREENAVLIRETAKKYNIPFICANSQTGEKLDQALEISARETLYATNILYRLTSSDQEVISNMIQIKLSENSKKSPASRLIREKNDLSLKKVLNNINNTDVLRAYHIELKNRLYGIRDNKDTDSEAQKKALGELMSMVRNRESELESKAISQQMLANATKGRYESLVHQLRDKLDNFYHKRGILAAGPINNFLSQHLKEKIDFTDKSAVNELEKHLQAMNSLLNDKNCLDKPDVKEKLYQHMKDIDALLEKPKNPQLQTEKKGLKGFLESKLSSSENKSPKGPGK